MVLAQHLAHCGSYSELGFVGYIKMKGKEKEERGDKHDEVGK